MSDNSEVMKPPPVEMPKPGEHLISQDYLRNLRPAIKKEDSNEYQQPPSTPDAHGRHIPKIYQITLTPEGKRASASPYKTPDEFRRARAENGTGPGGTKEPAYPREPDWTALPGPAGLNVDFGAELEVVGVQTDQLGNRELVVKYVSGPANFFPGGNRNNPGIRVDDIGQVDGTPKAEFFGSQVFTIGARDEVLNKLKQKPEAKPSLLKRAASKLLRR